MVTDVEGDTGFVVPIKTAKQLSNIRFQLLPEMFELWKDLKSERNQLQLRVTNLEQQVGEFEAIVKRDQEASALLRRQLDETEKVLKRKSFGLKFYRLAATVLGVSTAVLLIAK